jgi:molybdenum cofactor cytidylyltransferase
MNDSAHSLHVIVLAAGSSSRLGQPKQLVKLGGRPALHLVVSNAAAVAGHAVTVVIGAHAQELTRLLAHSPASVVVNRHWEEGMASSLRIGLAAVPASASAVLVILGDQVAVSVDDLKRLINAWNGHDTVIASAVYQGHAGVPAIFPRWSFSELRELRGNRGARMIIERHAQRLVHVQMPNAAIDLDTPEDLAALTEQFKKKPGEAVH